MKEIGIVFLTDRALKSKIILTDLNDVLKSTGLSPKSRTPKRKSGRHKTSTHPFNITEEV